MVGGHIAGYTPPGYGRRGVYSRVYTPGYGREGGYNPGIHHLGMMGGYNPGIHHPMYTPGYTPMYTTLCTPQGIPLLTLSDTRVYTTVNPLGYPGLYPSERHNEARTVLNLWEKQG